MASFIPTPEQIDAVHEWRRLDFSHSLRRPIVPLLTERFGLSYADAVAVVRAAQGGADATP